jgi:UTP:GlnB (protein PII) uridylyltransferase
MSQRLGYVERGGLRAVERFMKHYFLVAKEVGDLTTILCSALEIEQVKASPGLTEYFNPLSWRTRRHIRSTSDFRIDNGPPERVRRRCVQARSAQPDPLLRAGRAHQRLLSIRLRCGCCAARCG